VSYDTLTIRHRFRSLFLRSFVHDIRNGKRLRPHSTLNGSYTATYDKNNLGPKSSYRRFHFGINCFACSFGVGWLERFLHIKLFGKIELGGKLVNHPDDGYFIGIEFIVDEAYHKRMPVPLEKSELMSFELGNFAIVERILGLKENEMHATVILSDLAIGSSKDKPWSNTANFIRVVNVDYKEGKFFIKLYFEFIN
jgi:hypothetical protein